MQKFRSLWQYCKDVPAVHNDNPIVNFTENNLTDSFNFKVKITGQTGDDGIKNFETMVSLKYSSNFWRALEMLLINCEVNLILTTNFANQNTTFAITDTKLYIPGVTLSTEDNAKLLQQLKSGFKKVINWN